MNNPSQARPRQFVLHIVVTTRSVKTILYSEAALNMHHNQDKRAEEDAPSHDNDPRAEKEDETEADASAKDAACVGEAARVSECLKEFYESATS